MERRGLRALSLPGKVGVIALVPVLGLGFLFAHDLRSQITNQALASARRTAQIVATTAVGPRLTAHDLESGLSPAKIETLNSIVSQGFAARNIERVKLWNPDGRVLYSDDHTLIGRTFPIDDDLGEALEGKVESDVSDLTASENKYERGLGGRLFEVYVPLKLGTDEPAGVFEMYMPYGPIGRAITKGTLTVYLLLGLLYAALLVLVFHQYREMRRRAAKEREAVENEAFEEVRRSESFLNSIVENLPNMIFVKDAADLRFVRFNAAGERLLGQSRDDLIGKNDYDFFSTSEADFFTSKDREVLDSGRELDIDEEPIDTPHGRRFLHTKKIPILDPDGNARYLLGISEDITERKAAEDEIRRAKDEAERANHAKSEFLSRVSHELRTPLNAILGFAQLLQRESLDADQASDVDHIHSAGRHLLELVNELLDMSQVDSGRFDVAAGPVPVRDVLTESLAIVAPLAETRGISITRDFPTSDDVHVAADRQRLKQVVLNLLSNAIKYNSDEGTVDVAYRVEGEALVMIEVTDSGAGISPVMQERLFTPFDRLDAAVGIEGTGLGLALSKKIVERMEGSLEIESAPGRGTTARVRLPLTHDSLRHHLAATPDS